MEKIDSELKDFKKRIKNLERIVSEKDGLITVNSENIEGLSYAFYLYIDGKAVEKSPYSLVSTHCFKVIPDSTEIFVKFFYKNSKGNKFSINKSIKEGKLPPIRADRKKNELVNNNFFESCLSLLEDGHITTLIIEFEKAFLNLNNKDKAHKYVQLIKFVELDGFREDSLQVLSKIAVELCEDRYTLMAHAGICVKYGSFIEANTLIIKLQNDYQLEEDKASELRKKLTRALKSYLNEFKFTDTSGLNYSSYSEITENSEDQPLSSITVEELFDVYKNSGMYDLLESVALSNIKKSSKQKAKLLNVIADSIKVLSLEDAIYLNDLSLSLHHSIKAYESLTTLYFENNKFYKSAYFLGFLDHYYSSDKHKLKSNEIVKKMFLKFDDLKKLDLVFKNKKNFLDKYVEVERVIDSDDITAEAEAEAEAEVDSFYLMGIEQRYFYLIDIYKDSGIDGLKNFGYEKNELLSDFNLSGYFILLADVIKNESIEDSESFVLESFLTAKSSKCYVNLITFCNNNHFELGCEIIRDIKKNIALNNLEYYELKKLIEVSPLNASLIEDKLVVGEELYNGYVPVNHRICYILHNSLPYASGGYATRAHGVANGLAQLGFEMYGINRPGYPFDVNKNFKDKDIELQVKVDDVLYIHTKNPKRKSLYRYDYMEESIEIYENYFLELKPQLVIAASAYISAFPALIAAKRLGIPFIYEVRGFWEVTFISRDSSYEQTDKFFMMKTLETVIAKNADSVFTLTNAMKKELEQRGVHSDKVSVVPNSCFPEKFTLKGKDTELANTLNIPPNVPVIGYIGTFVDYEGLENLTQACGMLKARGVEFRLLLVGSENTSTKHKGSITKLIEKYAENYEIKDWLILTGRVPHEQVESLYSLIDIAPFPRKAWPVCEMVSPMKPLEALAMKKAVIVSSVDALQEMITDGQTGLVFDKDDIGDLANKLQDLILDDNLRRELGEKGREWVEKNRSWNITMEKAQKVIERINS